MGLILSLFFNVRPIPPQYQVFINFRGEVMRTEFVWYLFQALKNEKVNVFIDEEEERGQKLTNLFTRIQQSRVAITIFTKDYTESHWCLDELAKIKECIDQGNIQAIPIFFKMEADDVKKLNGKFGDNFKELKRSGFKHETIQKWEEALACVSANFGLCSSSYRLQADFLKAIVDAVKKALINISEREKLIKEENKKPNLIENGEGVIKKVFINFRGADMRRGFIGFLMDELKREEVNVFSDVADVRGRELSNLFTGIQESKIALTIFSKGYTESTWCLDELVKIKECMDQGNLQVIPVFFNVEASDVKKLKGKFGYNFQELVQNREEFIEKAEKWKQALEAVSARYGLSSSNYRYDLDMVKAIVEKVKNLLRDMA